MIKLDNFFSGIETAEKDSENLTGAGGKELIDGVSGHTLSTTSTTTTLTNTTTASTTLHVTNLDSENKCENIISESEDLLERSHRKEGN